MPGETVLVIDDSPTILKVVQLVLTKARYRVETAADGEEGLEKARALEPHLILLDFVMPRMNGYQFCREMANEPTLKDIPIVLMSAKGDQVGERFIKVMGVVDYITKPFSPEAIASVVQQTLAKFARVSPDAEAEFAPEDVAALAEADAADAAREAEDLRKHALANARSRIADALQQALATSGRTAPPHAAGSEPAAVDPAPRASAPGDGSDLATAFDEIGHTTIEFPDEDEDDPTMSRSRVSASDLEDITAVGGPPKPSRPLAAALEPEESTVLAARFEPGASSNDASAFGEPPAMPAEEASGSAPADAGAGSAESEHAGERAPANLDVHALSEAALDDALLTDIVHTTAAALDATVTKPSLTGDLRVIPIAEVLQLLDTQEQSGILALEKDGGRVEIYYRKGKIDLATSKDVSEDFLLGRFLVALELINQADFDSFLASRSASNKLIGAQLVMLNYINESALKTALERQTCELIYEVLRWRSGSFALTSTRELPAPATEAALGLDVGAVLMEGFRRVDEWHLIERDINDFDTVFLRNEEAVTQMGRGRLTREELAVLELVNGKNTVKDIIRHSRMGSFDVSKMLYRLLSIQLVRRRVAPVAV